MALSIGNGVVGSFPATLVAAQNNCWPSPSTIMCVAIGGVYYTMQSGVKPAMATTSHPPLSPNYEKICCPCPAGGCGLTP